MTRFHHVAVLMGGASSEREISLKSGAAVVAGLRGCGYRVSPVDVSGKEIDIPDDVDASFIALHGAFGEDGGVQAILDGRRMPYTGSGAEASRRAMDKVVTKEILADDDIPTPTYEVLGPGVVPTMPLPIVVKPAREGSSIGVHVVRSPDELGPALEDARRFDDVVLAEAYIDGKELTVGVVDGEALPVVEIVPTSNWYDYGAKYEGRTRYLVPAPVEDYVTEACQHYALQTFDVLGCRGFARVDFRVARSGKPRVLELNSIPGFTRTSLLPKAAAAAGIDFGALCDRILHAARYDA